VGAGGQGKEACGERGSKERKGKIECSIFAEQQRTDKAREITMQWHAETNQNWVGGGGEGELIYYFTIGKVNRRENGKLGSHRLWYGRLGGVCRKSGVQTQ